MLCMNDNHTHFEHLYFLANQVVLNLRIWGTVSMTLTDYGVADARWGLVVGRSLLRGWRVGTPMGRRRRQSAGARRSP